MPECVYINCEDPAAKDGKCGPHYNAILEYMKKREEQEMMSPAQIKKAEEYQKQLDMESIEEMIDLDWWFLTYGVEEHPAKFINKQYYALVNWDESVLGVPDKGLIELSQLTKNESRLLNEKLKELDGTLINGGTHIWTFTGKKHFLREGTHNHFACVPIDN